MEKHPPRKRRVLLFGHDLINRGKLCKLPGIAMRASGASFATSVVLLLIAAGVMTGCGESDKPDPLKKSQFVAQANSICERAEEEREKATKAGRRESPEALMQSLLSPVQSMTEELGELGPPVGDEKQVEAIIAAFEEGIKKLEADPGGPDSALAFVKANKLAEQYGLTSCPI